MSKLECICGNIIIDQSDFLAYKAEFVRHQDLDIIDKRVDDVSSFVNAITTGNRNNWLNEYFGSNIYETISDSNIISDIITRNTLDYESIIYQCQICGRIKVQIGKTNKFLSFIPENNEWQDLLKGLSKK